jgi:hypothetical protein
MVIPEGPGLSNAEMQKICKEKVVQPRKLGDDDAVILVTTARYSAGIEVSLS